MSRLLCRWMKTNGAVLINAGSLVATYAITSGLGFAFWWFAARHFSPQAIGFASAAISATQLLGTSCMLGLGTLLIRELPRQQGKEVTLISAALTVVGVVGGCSGLLFAVVFPSLSANLQPLRESLESIALFAVGVSLAAITLVLDQALIGLLRGDLQLWRNTLFAGAKLVALCVASFWFSLRAGLAIYATWVIGYAVSLAALTGFAARSGKLTGRRYLPHPGSLRKLGSAALQHHLLNLILQGPGLALPVLVTVLISATMNAWFYVPFTLTGIIFIFPYALVTALYATSSARPGTLARKARLTIGLAVIACALANCVLLFGSGQLLGIFGQSYAEQGAWSLRILGLGAFPYIIKDHYVAIHRVHDRVSNALPLSMAGALFELGGAALGARLGGLAGVSLGWIIALYVEAAFMFRGVYTTIRSGGPSNVGDQLQT
jgi:O-antigen/teichoic acid export membrane protein